MSAADRLREAAKVLRESAEAATPGPWRWDGYRVDLPFLVGQGGDPATYRWDQEVIEAEHRGECGCRSACHLELNVRGGDQTYIATMHPGVGLALADWLDDVARSWAPHFEDDEPAYDFDGHPIRFEETCDARSLRLADLILGGAA